MAHSNSLPGPQLKPATLPPGYHKPKVALRWSQTIHQQRVSSHPTALPPEPGGQEIFHHRKQSSQTDVAFIAKTADLFPASKDLLVASQRFVSSSA
jgi:hypothetical protein